MEYSRIIRHPATLVDEIKGFVLAIGNFDGLHQGHRTVITTARSIARSDNRVPFGIVTFEPHPYQVLKPDHLPLRLSTLRTKLRFFESLEVDYVIVLRFDVRLQQTRAEDFVSKILIGQLKARHLIVGHDFRFGRDRQGDVTFLRHLTSRWSTEVTIVDKLKDATGKPYSSSAVRHALARGDLSHATSILGHPWYLSGRVRKGDQRGRTIGFPTANIDLGDHVRPAFGVYAVYVGIDQGAQTIWHHGVANLGRRPTVGGTEERLEVHLFDFVGDLYGKNIIVQLIDYLRAEQRFDGYEALKAQIISDAANARNRLAISKQPAHL